MEKQRLSFILCQTRFASNLGSSARVLENFGFRNLILVNPHCSVGAEARTFAMKGAPLLDRAPLLPALEEARNHVDLLLATSAHSFRGGPRPVPLRRFYPDIVIPHRPRRIGIVFGSEKNGLSRQELSVCNWTTQIPTDSEYQSLNLAQAVAVVAYTCHVSSSQEPFPASEPGTSSLSDAQWKALMTSLEELIERLSLPHELSTRRILKRLTQMAARAQLSKQDADLLLGLFKRIV